MLSPKSTLIYVMLMLCPLYDIFLFVQAVFDLSQKHSFIVFILSVFNIIVCHTLCLFLCFRSEFDYWDSVNFRRNILSYVTNQVISIGSITSPGSAVMAQSLGPLQLSWDLKLDQYKIT